MSELILSPTSIYRKSEANFILNKDALFAFVRSISSINDSLYGIQPTPEMLRDGFTLSDIFAINPLSTNFSICADVYVLQDNVDALKYFAQRPFVKCESVEQRNEIATDPLAVYLTPIPSSDTDQLEWIFVFNDPIGWDTIKEYADGQHYLSAAEAALSGKWELIGSTSFTDKQISSLFAMIEHLDGKLTDEAVTRKTADEELSDALDSFAEATNARFDGIDGEIENLDSRVTVLETKTETLEENLSGLSSEFTGFKTETEENLDNLDRKIDAEKTARETADEDLDGKIAAETAAREAADEELDRKIAAEKSAREATDSQLDGKIDGVSGRVSTIENTIPSLATKDEIPTAVSELDNDVPYATEQELTSNYVLKSEIPTNVSQLNNDAGYITDAALEDYALKSEIPTKVSELDNDSGFIDESALDDYALTSDVKDGILEIQQNETTLGTFSANQEAGTTVNVVVPTKVSDLDNDVPYLTTADIEPINNAIQDLQDENDRQGGDIRGLRDRVENLESDNGSIHDDIDQINNRIDEIDIKAINAQNMADEAKGTAITAYTMAENAQTAAETAATAASTAQSTAEAAQTTANSNTAAIESITDEISELPNIYYKHSMDDVVGDSSENWADNYVGTAACVDLYGNHYFPDGQQHNGGVLFSSERGQILIGYDGSGNVGMWYRSYSETGVQKNAWTILDTMKSPLPSGIPSQQNLGEWLVYIDHFLGSLPSTSDIIGQDGDGSLYKGSSSSNRLQEPPKIDGNQLALVRAIAREYSGSSAQPGQYVTREGYLYRCISATSGGAFNPNYWEEVSVADDFATKNELSTISAAIETEFLTLSSDIVDGLSNAVIPKLDVISGLVKEEVTKLDTLSSQLSNYIKKEDAWKAIAPNISAYADYATGAAIPTAISSVVEWNKGLHAALSELAELFGPIPV